MEPARVDLLGGNKYYFLLKDLAAHEEKIYFLKIESEALAFYKKYKAPVQFNVVP